MTAPDINTAIDIIARFFPDEWTVRKKWGELSAESLSGAVAITVALAGPLDRKTLDAQIMGRVFARPRLTRSVRDDLRIHRLELDQAARVMDQMAVRFEQWSWTKEDLMKEEP